MKRVEDWSLGYEILRPIGYLVHRVAHRSITVYGLENIPKDGPIILAPNHQNALSDSLAVILTCNLQPVFLGRADIFKKKLAAKILNFFKISPVYRIRDGKETLDRNQEVFDNCVEILKKNKVICIYPEASHVGLKSMNPHKKAIPRIALLAAEKTNFEIDVKVVPVGLYFSHYYQFRRDLIVCYGEPISSKNYYQLYKEEGEAKATLQFRNDLYQAIRKIVVNVDDRKSYELYEQGFDMFKPQLYQKLGLKNRPGNAVKAEQYLTEKLDAYFEKDPSEKEELLKKAQLYKRLKSRMNISEKIIQKGPIGIGQLILNYILVLLLMPFALYGLIANGWLFFLTRYPYRKMITDPLFYSTFAFGLGFILFPIWYIGQFFILIAIFKCFLIALGLLVFSIPSGILAWELGQVILLSAQRLKLNMLTRKNNKTLQQLISLRTELLSFYKKSIA